MPTDTKRAASIPTSRSSRRPIVVGTDFTRSSEAAVRRAAQVAGALGAPLLLVHAVAGVGPSAAVPMMEPWLGAQASSPASPTDALGAALQRGENSLAAIGLEGVEAERLVRPGAPYESLVSAAKGRRAQLIVVGVRPPKSLVEKYLLGATAERVLRAGRCPVLVVRKAGYAPYTKILVAVDFTPVSLRILAITKQTFPEAKLVLGTVVSPEAGELGARERASIERALRHLAATAGYEPEEVAYAVETGEAREGVLSLVGAAAPQLVALGTHGRSGVTRLLLGSTAEYLVRAIQTDVLVVPPPNKSLA